MFRYHMSFRNSNACVAVVSLDGKAVQINRWKPVAKNFLRFFCLSSKRSSFGILLEVLRVSIDFCRTFIFHISLHALFYSVLSFSRFGTCVLRIAADFSRCLPMLPFSIALLKNVQGIPKCTQCTDLEPTIPLNGLLENPEKLFASLMNRLTLFKSLRLRHMKIWVTLMSKFPTRQFLWLFGYEYSYVYFTFTEELN